MSIGRIKRKQIYPVRNTVNVIAHGFGCIALRWRCGVVCRYGKNSVDISFKDQDGTFIETYSAISGRRICDIGSKSGWEIIVDDLIDRPALIYAAPLQQEKIVKLHEEVRINSDGEEIYWQVYMLTQGNGKKDMYLKSFVKKVTSTKKVGGQVIETVKEAPALIPFPKILELITEFVEN